MAKYTTQIRSIVESGYPLFDFDYPIFDSNYKGVLEQNIINHYYFREIGFETVGQFKWFLKSWFQLNMPYYNRLYETEFLITKEDYMINLDNETKRTIKTNQESKNDSTASGTNSATNTASGTNSVTNTASGSSNGKTTSSNNGKTVFSDTPQARLQGQDYATNLTETDDDGTTNTEGSSQENSTSEGNSQENSTSEGSSQETASTTGTLTTIEEYTEHFLGNASMRYNADILEEWKQTWRNIDKLIIEELNQFFMNIY